MPRTQPNTEQLALRRLFANPANNTQAMARQQDSALSGAVPGDPNVASVVAEHTGILQPYGSTAAGAWQTSGVGRETLNLAGNPAMRHGSMILQFGGSTVHQDAASAVLDKSGNVAMMHGVVATPNPFAGSPAIEAAGALAHSSDGNPAAVMGSMNASGGTNNVNDGGLFLVDPTSNVIAGYSHSTGLFGFGSMVQLVYNAQEITGFSFTGSSGKYTATIPNSWTSSAAPAIPANGAVIGCLQYGTIEAVAPDLFGFTGQAAGDMCTVTLVSPGNYIQSPPTLISTLMATEGNANAQYDNGSGTFSGLNTTTFAVRTGLSGFGIEATSAPTFTEVLLEVPPSVAINTATQYMIYTTTIALWYAP